MYANTYSQSTSSQINQELQRSLSNAKTTITVGSVITVAGIALIISQSMKYSTNSKDLTTESGYLENINKNQLVMNKTISNVIYGATGVVVAAIGVNTILRGVARINDIQLQMVSDNFTSSVGLGLKLRF